MQVAPLEGYRVWARSYDETPNPLTALERRTMEAWLDVRTGDRLLDAGSGTGRWMLWAAERGARVFGIDFCEEMILEAERKPRIAGRSVLADIVAIPVRDGAFDTAICSLTLGYVSSPDCALRELARVARRVVVSDFHPEAIARGWRRSFQADGTGEVHELRHYDHTIEQIDRAAIQAGLVREWRVDASFGEPEREIFRRAGREQAFDEMRRVRAILITAWRKS